MTSPRFNGQSEKMGNVLPIAGSQIIDTDILSGEPVIHRMVSGLKAGSIALLDTEFRTDKRMSAHPVTASFIEKTDLGLGRDEGQHETRFGQIITNGQGYSERPFLAAVKPFNEHRQRGSTRAMVREWSATNYVNAVGDKQLGFLPLGAWRNSAGVNHLVSLYEHEVISLDSVFWADKRVRPEALRPKVLEQAFADSIRGLGYLHGIGVAHGDAEAKNLAVDRTGFRFIDLESATPLPHSGSRISGSEESIKLIRNDLESFFDSSIQESRNRTAVGAVLDKTRMDGKLAGIYRAGIQRARKDTGIRMADLPTSTDAYFKATVDHTLKLAEHTEDY